MYRDGQGVPQDYAQAVAWYRKAAEQGDNWGQYVFGAMYRDGLCVPKDYVRAHMRRRTTTILRDSVTVSPPR